MADKKPNFHRQMIRFLLAILVVGPLLWITASRDGQRFADSVVLSLRGDPELALALEHLRSDVREEELRTVLKEVELECAPAATPFGDRLCRQRISTFNGIPARHVNFYYADQTLTAMQIAYQTSYHEALHDYVGSVFGAATIEAAEPVELWAWSTAYGRLMMVSEQPEHLNDAVLMWMGYSQQ